MFVFTQNHKGSLKLERDHPIPVWVLTVRKVNTNRSPSDDFVQSIQKDETISEAVKESDWALVLNLHRVRKGDKAGK